VVVDFNFRFSPSPRPRLKQRVLQAVLDRHGVDYDLVWTLGGEPFLTTPGHLSERWQRRHPGRDRHPAELSTTGGTSTAASSRGSARR
jgi:succinyl-diaminopimelate desuccinylase